MIGLDTNVLIRYLTQDDPSQAEIANRMIQKVTAHSELLWVSQITLCEVVWVLDRAYKMSKVELMDILTLILQTQELVVEMHDVVWRALHDYKMSKSVGFVDCLIGRLNEVNDCSFTYTFDKSAAVELTTFHLLKH